MKTNDDNKCNPFILLVQRQIEKEDVRFVLHHFQNFHQSISAFERDERKKEIIQQRDVTCICHALRTSQFQSTINSFKKQKSTNCKIDPSQSNCLSLC